MAGNNLETRLEAARLAVAMLQGADELDSARLFALIIFFESYLDDGTDATERNMRLLRRRQRGKLEVIAGGKL